MVFYDKELLTARKLLYVAYTLESLVVMVAPIVYAVGAGLAGEYGLLAAVVVLLLLISPVRIVCIRAVKGYYNELSYILHNRRVNKTADVESQRAPRLCDQCEKESKHGEIKLRHKDDSDIDVMSQHSRSSKGSR